MTSTSYTSEWSAAVERSERFGLTVPAHHVEPDTRYLTAQRIAEFPYVVRRGLGDVGAPDVMAQCLSMHHRLLPFMADWFGCALLYTLGWVDDGTETGMFKSEPFHSSPAPWIAIRDIYISADTPVTKSYLNFLFEQIVVHHDRIVIKAKPLNALRGDQVPLRDLNPAVR